MHRSPANLQSKHMKPVLLRGQATRQRIHTAREQRRGGGARQGSEQSPNYFPSCPTTGRLFSPLPLCSSRTQCPVFQRQLEYSHVVLSPEAQTLYSTDLICGPCWAADIDILCWNYTRKNRSFCADRLAFLSHGWRPYAGSPTDWDLPKGKAGPGPSLDHPRLH